MTANADVSVKGGLEVSHLTAITHAVDDQKNRQGRRRDAGRKKPPPQQPEGNNADGDDAPDDEDQDKPTVDFLA